MLIRGSAQLLLLFFRSLPRLGWSVGCTALILVLATLLHASGDFPLMTRSGLAQQLRQSAWEHALAGLPQQTPWPWAETSAAANAGVAQLGLSAAVIKEDNPGEAQGFAIRPLQRTPRQDPHLADNGFSEIGVGDRITVTTTNGASQVYSVTGRKVVDPHLAETSPGASEDAATANCLPLDPVLANSLRLVIQGTLIELPATHKPQAEQKL
jgi:hypothetical protein